MPADPVHEWIESLVERHTRSLSRPEFLKAVRALSARYVERRSDIAGRPPVDSAGKRAAFAAFFAPLHFLTTRDIVRMIGEAADPVAQIIDLGCGTGAASAGWSLAVDQRPAIVGVDRQSWALNEAVWNWRSMGLLGRTRRIDLVEMAADLARRPSPRTATSILAAWSINELSVDARRALLPGLLSLAGRGYQVLVIEPLARTAVPWWNEWADQWQERGGKAAEWKIRQPLPGMLADLSEAAGFQREYLGARTLMLRSH